MMKKILAIDDQKDNLITIKGFLKNFLPDCTLFLAESGKEGIAIAQKEQPDTILLDIIMPEMDGFEVCEILKQNELTKYIPIIMLSALGQDTDSRVKGLNLGADAFLAKPFIPVELQAQINVMLRIKEAEDIMRAEKDVLKESVSIKTSELKESDEKYQSMFENMLNGFAYHKIVTDRNGKPVDYIFLEVNKGFEDLTGLKRKDLLGKNATDAMPGIENDPADWIGTYGKVALTGEDIRFENFSESLNKYYSIYAYSPQPGHFVTIFEDINDRKLAEEKLQNSEERYKSLVTNLPIGIFRSTYHGKVLSVNPAMAEIYGYDSEEDLLNVPAQQYYTSDNQRNIMLSELEKNESLLGYETMENKKDGSTVWVSTNYKITKNNKKELTYIDGAVIDITNRKKVEEAFKLSEEQNRSITQTAADGIISIDQEGILLSWNNAAEKIFGYSSSEMINQNLSRIIPEKYQMGHDKGITRLKEGGKEKILGSTVEISATRKGGKEFPIELSLSSWESDNQKFYTGIIRDITRRKLAEEERKQSEERFKRLFNGLGDAVFVTLIGGKNQGRILEINAAALSQTGYSRDELLDMNINTDIAVAGSANLNFDKWEEKLLKGETVTTIEKKKRKDGTEYWTEMIVTLTDFKGKKASLSINHDITNRILANKALKESEEKYHELIDTTSEGFWLLNSELKTVDVNKSLIEMLGYSKDEIIGKNPLEFVDETNKDIFKNQFAKIATSLHRNYDILLTKKNGTKFPAYLSATSLVDEDGNTTGSFAFVSDFTERNLAKENVFKYSKLFEDSLNEIFLFDIDSLKFTQVNNAGISNLGYSLAELQQMTPFDIKPEYDEEKFKAAIKPLLNNTIERVEFQTLHQRKDGSNYFAEIYLQLIEFKGSRFYAAIIMDITKRKESEDRLKSALEKATESDRLKSAFLATMSHELRTPLNAIIGFSDLINPEWPIEEVYEFAHTINSSGTHLLSIVEDLFDLTLIESGETKIRKKDVEISPLLGDIHEIMLGERQKLQKENIELRLLTPDKDERTSLVTDSLKLKQILINLVKNALKFTHEGQINYGFTNEYIDGSSYLRFYVSDTGIGISKDKQKFIFNPFRQIDDSHTRTYEGIGIGLSISKKLTELLGGSIWLESEENVGSTFYFTIPYEKCITNDKSKMLETNEVSAAESKEKVISSSKTLLIVEDDEASYELLKILIGNPLVNIMWAKNGSMAINYCKNNQNIDLVLMDINMPIMNGHEATKEIRKIRPKLPIIAQTAYAIAGDKEKALDAGCDDYISKPIKKELLKEKIDKWLWV